MAMSVTRAGKAEIGWVLPGGDLLLWKISYTGLLLAVIEPQPEATV